MQMGEGPLTPFCPTLTPDWMGLPATPRRPAPAERLDLESAPPGRANGPGRRWPGPFTSCGWETCLRLGNLLAGQGRHARLDRGLEREVAGGHVPVAERPERRLFPLAPLLRERAPGAEPAPGRR